MELTQEYFDKGLSNLLGQIKGKMSTIEAKMATKGYLKVQTIELKQYTHEAFETQQQYLDERF